LERPGFPESDLLDDLEELGSKRGDDVFDVDWTNADGVEILRNLRDAAAGMGMSA
jgi:hypothetical protein